MATYNMKLNGKLKFKFLYGSDPSLKFRIRLDEHALDQMTVREKSGKTKMELIRLLRTNLERPELKILNLPTERDYPIFYIEETDDVFLCLLRKPDTPVQNVDKDLIICTYLAKEDRKIIANYDGNVCYTFHKDGRITQDNEDIFRFVSRRAG